MDSEAGIKLLYIIIGALAIIGLILGTNIIPRLMDKIVQGDEDEDGPSGPRSNYLEEIEEIRRAQARAPRPLSPLEEELHLDLRMLENDIDMDIYSHLLSELHPDSSSRGNSDSHTRSHSNSHTYYNLRDIGWEHGLTHMPLPPDPRAYIELSPIEQEMREAEEYARRASAHKPKVDEAIDQININL